MNFDKKECINCSTPVTPTNGSICTKLGGYVCYDCCKPRRGCRKCQIGGSINEDPEKD